MTSAANNIAHSFVVKKGSVDQVVIDGLFAFADFFIERDDFGAK
jgi:hypothetical protein